MRIEIVHPRARRLGLERMLVERFGLTDAVVVPAPDGDDGTLERVAQAAADFLYRAASGSAHLGVSWGRTLRAVAEALPDGWANGVTVVQLNGGVSLNRRSGGAAGLAVTIAQRASGQVSLLPSPAILERVETKQAIESDRTVAAVLEEAAEAQAFLFTAGPCDASSAHVENGYLTGEEVEELARRGAVATFSAATSMPRATSSTRSSTPGRSACRSTGCAEPPTRSSSRRICQARHRTNGRDQWPVRRTGDR